MIACKNICAAYANHKVLHGVNFEAQGGEFVAIIGPNGSGKSTFLNVLSGILEQSLGEVTVMGQDITKLSVGKRALHMAVVPQRLENIPQITVQDMVLLGRYAHLAWFGLYAEKDYEIAQKSLYEVGADALQERSLHTLSGGELQRVLLARALAQATPVLLLDELSAGLDVARMIEVFDILDKKRKEQSCIITIMHDINLAALYATRIVGLKKGKIFFDGPVAEVFTEANLQELYGTKIHVFKHPMLDIPQACPGR